MLGGILAGALGGGGKAVSKLADDSIKDKREAAKQALLDERVDRLAAIQMKFQGEQTDKSIKAQTDIALMNRTQSQEQYMAEMGMKAKQHDDSLGIKEKELGLKEKEIDANKAIAFEAKKVKAAEKEQAAYTKARGEALKIWADPFKRDEFAALIPGFTKMVKEEQLDAMAEIINPLIVKPEGGNSFDIYLNKTKEQAAYTKARGEALKIWADPFKRDEFAALIPGFTKMVKEEQLDAMAEIINPLIVKPEGDDTAKPVADTGGGILSPQQVRWGRPVEVEEAIPGMPSDTGTKSMLSEKDLAKFADGTIDEELLKKAAGPPGPMTSKEAAEKAAMMADTSNPMYKKLFEFGYAYTPQQAKRILKLLVTDPKWAGRLAKGKR